MPKPLDDTMFTYHRDTWPYRPLAKFSSGPVQVQRKSLAEAESALKDFAQVREAVLSDKTLSEVGKRERLAAWADKNLPALRKRVDEVDEGARGLEKTLELSVMKKLSGEGETFVAQILSYLAGLKDETARIDFISARMRRGDFAPLKAALMVPSYLAGVGEEMLADLRADAMRLVDPEQTADIGLVRQGRETSERALKSALSTIEAALAEPLEGGPAVNAPAPRPAPPSREQIERVNAAIRANSSPETLARLDITPEAPQAA